MNLNESLFIRKNSYEDIIFLSKINPIESGGIIFGSDRVVEEYYFDQCGSSSFPLSKYSLSLSFFDHACKSSKFSFLGIVHTHPSGLNLPSGSLPDRNMSGETDIKAMEKLLEISQLPNLYLIVLTDIPGSNFQFNTFLFNRSNPKKFKEYQISVVP